MSAKRASFYQQVGSHGDLDKLVEIRRLFHEYCSHPNLNEMVRMTESCFPDSIVIKKDIHEWNESESKICTGCLEG